MINTKRSILGLAILLVLVATGCGKKTPVAESITPSASKTIDVADTIPQNDTKETDKSKVLSESMNAENQLSTKSKSIEHSETSVKQNVVQTKNLVNMPTALCYDVISVKQIVVQTKQGWVYVGELTFRGLGSLEGPKLVKMDPEKEVFVIVIRGVPIEELERQMKLGLQIGKAYRWFGDDQYEYLRDVDLTLSDSQIGELFGAYSGHDITRHKR